MTTPLRDILNKFRDIAQKSPESEYDNIWLQRSKRDDSGDYDNQTTNLEVLSKDESDEYIYNVWARTTEDGLIELDKFVETELIPKGMQLLAGQNKSKSTEVLSSDQGAIRFMIARPNIS